MALKRKNLMVDEEQLKELAKRLGMSESAAMRYSVDGLLHFLEIEEAAEKIRKRGGLDEEFYRHVRREPEAKEARVAG